MPQQWPLVLGPAWRRCHGQVLPAVPCCLWARGLLASAGRHGILCGPSCLLGCIGRGKPLCTPPLLSVFGILLSLAETK